MRRLGVQLITQNFARLMIFFTLSLLAVTAAVGAHYIMTRREIALETAALASGAAAEAMARDVRGSIETVDSALLRAISIDRDGTFPPTPRGVQSPVSSPGRPAADVTKGIYITDAAGQVVYDTDGSTPPDLNVAEREFFIPHTLTTSADLLVTGPAQDRVDGSWILFLSRRIEQPDGHFAGVAVGSVAVDLIEKFSDKEYQPYAGTILVFKSPGTVILRNPPRASDIGRNISHSALIRKIAGAHEGIFDTFSPFDGNAESVAYRQVYPYPLGVAVAMPNIATSANWLQQDIVVAAIFSMIVWIVTSWLFRPERRLRLRLCGGQLRLEAPRHSRERNKPVPHA